MLELPNPFADKGGVIRLLESRNCDREAIVDRVLSRLYARPFVIEDDGARALLHARLHPERDASVPYALQFAYTRKMMGFLLFRHEPREILMLGLGGGSLAKYWHRHHPAARIRVEIDPDVIAFRDQFAVPPNDSRFSVVRGDAAQ
jgi:spermidine synthase